MSEAQRGSWMLELVEDAHKILRRHRGFSSTLSVQIEATTTHPLQTVVNGHNMNFIPLHIAARCGHVNVMEMLARRGANLEAAVSRVVPDGYRGQALPKGARALHAAVMSGQPGAV